jgi:hypothetical protein
MVRHETDGQFWSRKTLSVLKRLEKILDESYSGNKPVKSDAYFCLGWLKSLAKKNLPKLGNENE